ncbi:hypothetical protein [Streptomyces sp. NPDC002580]|uniref:hypothetical protein n=1 Tax=Streptomyces sp. NPDC002580 TaxID=3364653 RepID=UPI0036974E90
MSNDDRPKPMRELDLERYRARYGLTAVVMSNLAVVCVAVFGVWQLNGDKAVTVGVLTAAFTAVSSTTTAYLGIKAVSNTARAMAQPRVPAAPVPGAATPPRTVPAPAAAPETDRDRPRPGNEPE